MAKYSLNNSVQASHAMAATYNSLLLLFGPASTPRRSKIYDILMGTNGTPADNYMEWDASRFTITAIFTLTATTPNALDPADAAALAQGLSSAAASTDGTYTAASSVFYIGVNQRASYRWVAAPGGEIVIPATAQAGVGFRARSAAYTGTATAEYMFEEQ